MRRAVSTLVRNDAAAAWAAAVRNNGGGVTDARVALIRKLVLSLKAAGSWQFTDDIWMLTAENAVQALTSLKQRTLGTAVAAPTFTTDAGYAFNGTTQYIDTGFNPNLHSRVLTIASARLGVYERTNVNANTYAAGAINNSSNALQIRPRNGSTVLGNANSQPATFTLASADSRGYLTMSKNGALATDAKAFKNGVSLTRTVDPGGVGSSLVNRNLLIGCYSNAGTPTTFRASTIGFVVIGAALPNDTTELADYNAYQAHMTALGANV